VHLGDAIISWNTAGSAGTTSDDRRALIGMSGRLRAATDSPKTGSTRQQAAPQSLGCGTV